MFYGNPANILHCVPRKKIKRSWSNIRKRKHWFLVGRGHSPFHPRHAKVLWAGRKHRPIGRPRMRSALPTQVTLAPTSSSPSLLPPLLFRTASASLLTRPAGPPPLFPHRLRLASRVAAARCFSPLVLCPVRPTRPQIRPIHTLVEQRPTKAARSDVAGRAAAIRSRTLFSVPEP